MVQFASYLRRVLCKTRLIFSRINGPNMSVNPEDWDVDFAFPDFNLALFERERS